MFGFGGKKRLDKDHPLSMKNLAGRLSSSIPFCVLDCEMTGLNAEEDDIISVGAVKIVGGKIVMNKRFHHVVRPHNLRMTRENVLIHGLSHEAVDGGEKPEEVYQKFSRFSEGCVLVGHFTSIDLKFLDALASKLKSKSLQQPALDTGKLHRWYLEREDRHRPPPVAGDLQLNRICRNMGAPTFQGHHAFFDALSTACLFIKQLDLLKHAGYYTYGDLFKIAGL